jgi:O-antigen ligase
VALYETLAVLLALTFWKPQLSFYLFILVSPLVSIFQDLGWDVRPGWACFLALRAAIGDFASKRQVNVRVTLAATMFFGLSAIVLRLNSQQIPGEEARAAWSFFLYFLAGSLFMFAASRFIRSEREAVLSLVFLGLAATEVAIYAVWQGYGIRANDGFDRVGSTLINPNALASFMGVCAIALISGRRLLPGRRWKIFVWSVFAIATLALLMSLSRAGLMAFLVGLILTWATKDGKLTLKKTAIVAGISFLVVLSVYTFLRTYRIQQAAAQTGDDIQTHTEIAQSMEDFTRYEAATFSLQQWSEHPLFGIGFETLAAVNYEKNGFYVTTHDTILQLLVGTGLVGVSLISYTFKQLWVGLPKDFRILFSPIGVSVAVNSLFGDFLGAIEMMAAVAIAYQMCKWCARDKQPAITA